MLVPASQFMNRLHTELLDLTKDGLVLQGNENTQFYNVYGIAHGGYLYTLSHVAVQLTGELCLGGDWTVQDVNCQFLNPMRKFPAKVETECIGGHGLHPYVRARLSDRDGKLCFEMSAVLGEDTDRDLREIPVPTIAAEHNMPFSCYETPNFPCITSTFANYLNIYSTEIRGSGLVYAVDPSEDNCDALGCVHPGAMFTAADAAAGGSLYYLQHRRPITVSASMHYFRKTAEGPVSAIPRLVRGGKALFYYDMDVIDRSGATVAAGHFIIQNTKTYTPEEFSSEKEGGSV